MLSCCESFQRLCALFTFHCWAHCVLSLHNVSIASPFEHIVCHPLSTNYRCWKTWAFHSYESLLFKHTVYLQYCKHLTWPWNGRIWVVYISYSYTMTSQSTAEKSLLHLFGTPHASRYTYRPSMGFMHWTWSLGLKRASLRREMKPHMLAGTSTCSLPPLLSM